jgi:hypothetical protein
MLARVAGLAKERDCGRLEWSVLDWNEPAIRLYRGIGAVSMDDWTVYRVTGKALEKLAARPDLRADAAPLYTVRSRLVTLGKGTSSTTGKGRGR